MKDLSNANPGTAQERPCARRLAPTTILLKSISVLLFNWLVVAGLSAQAHNVYYVALAGNDNDGLSWATARQTIQAAVNGAPAGAQIWVAAGVYSNTHATVPAGVELYGGFMGREKGLGQHDPTVNVTTLDAGGSGTVL